MIYRIEQVERMIRRRHEVKNLNGEIVYHARTPVRFVAEVIMDDSLIRVRLNGMGKYLITKDDVEIGELKQDMVKTKKVLFMQIDYEYYKFEIEGRCYQVFESGLGPGMHFYSMYEDGVVVGVIHKQDRIVNDLDHYTLYTEDEVAMKDLVVYTMFLASTEYFKTTDAGYSIDDASVYTAQQELRDKYDPTFIPRIKAMDGIRD